MARERRKRKIKSGFRLGFHQRSERRRERNSVINFREALSRSFLVRDHGDSEEYANSASNLSRGLFAIVVFTWIVWMFLIARARKR